MSLTIQDLFVPDPSGVDLQNPSAPPAVGSWRAKLLDLGVIVGLATTDWNAGGITRSILSLLSLALNASDQIVSTDLQGGFLDWAASVTDDPASLGTAARPGWLDALTDGNYNVQRIAATFARGTVTLTNTSAVTYGPFSPWSYHLSDPTTGATYRNVNTLTLPPGATSGTLPNGPPDAYRFFATSAFALLAAMTPSVAMSQPVTRALVQSNLTNGEVNVIVANAAGDVVGLVNAQISTATNASPIKITIPNTSVVNTGDWAFVSGVQGNTNANGFHQVTVVNGTDLNLNGTTGNGAYTGGGAAEIGDLGLVDYIIHANVVPLGITEFASSATSLLTTVAVSLYVPAASVPVTAGIAQTAIAQYFAAAPIGGYVTGVPVPHTLPVQGLIAAITQALFQAKIVATDASATLDGSASDLPVGATEVPKVNGTPTVTVIGS